ncbi:hypothetical protein CWB73_15220 [Pseudoalteromonas phenolica]|uniref:Uncharacterized protein n=1 Tax=Pseudoalteromonas phenolica TaxID=161398 RepID=A0A4Q7IL37_9GAMM|nr:hypothetical protein [Pseudoalteromonas phenolica]RZQ52365.1 hypothetical protein C1E23_14545 [Pseudoalteromonas phenolica]TMP78870.1 hypothetical protein CWB73_15220 [Pseudoalteromonas phenolica]
MKHSKLHKTKRFWSALLIPTLLAGVITFLIYSNGNYITCYTAKCFNFTFETYKVPISIFALIVPALALCVATHRSEYQVIQLSKQNEINQATNFFKHREMIIEKLKDLEFTLGIKFKSRDWMYENLFKGNSPLQVSYVPTVDLFNAFEEDVRSLLLLAESITPKSSDLDRKVPNDVLNGFINKSTEINLHLYEIQDKIGSSGDKCRTDVDKIDLIIRGHKLTRYTRINISGYLSDILLHYEFLSSIEATCSINGSKISEKLFSSIDEPFKKLMRKNDNGSLFLQHDIKEKVKQLKCKTESS